MILCAGLGSRLRPLTDRWPKPACPVVNRPLVAYSLALLRGVGIEVVVVNTHHLADSMAEVAGRAAAELHLSLSISRESVLLGTGGGLAAAAPQFKGGTLVLLNGDFLYDVDLAAALAAHRRTAAPATLLVQPPLAGYRPLHAWPDGRLACLPGDSVPAGAVPWHFTGVHLLEPAIFAHLRTAPSGIFETGYRGLLRSGAPVRVHVDGGRWQDIGEPAQLLTANLDLLGGRFPLGGYAKLPPLQAVDPQARVAGEVVDSAIGPGAIVPAGARVVASVVFGGTQLGAGELLRRTIAAGPIRLAFPDLPPTAGD